MKNKRGIWRWRHQLIFLLLLLPLNLHAKAPVAPLDLELIRAAHIGDLQRVKAAITNGANLEVRYQERATTPLLIAVREGHLEIVNALIQAGANLDATTNAGKGGVLYAIYARNLPILKRLIAAGANPALSSAHYSALFYAANIGEAEMVRVLLSHDHTSDINRRVLPNPDTFEYKQVETTALIQTIEARCLDCVQQLLTAGADPNLPTSRGESPLLVALKYGESAIADILIKQGAKLDAVDQQGNSLFTYALERGDDDLALRAMPENIDALWFDEAVLERGALDDWEVESPSHKELNDPYRGRYNALHLAAIYGRVTIIDALLERGMSLDIRAKGQQQYPPLGFAAMAGHYEAFMKLIERGADPFERYQGGQQPGNPTHLSNGLSTPIYYAGGVADHYTPLSLSFISKKRDHRITQYLMGLPEFERYLELINPSFYLYLSWYGKEKLGYAIYHVLRQQLDDLGYQKSAALLSALSKAEKIKEEGAIKKDKKEKARKKRAQSVWGYLKKDDPEGAINHVKSGKVEKDETPLHSAVLEEHYQLVKALVEAGADIERTNQEGENILHYIVDKHLFYTHPAAYDLIHWLVEEQGMDLNSSNGVILHKLIEIRYRVESQYSEHLQRYDELIEWAIRRGANLGAQATDSLQRIYRRYIEPFRIAVIADEMVRLKQEADLTEVLDHLLQKLDGRNSSRLYELLNFAYQNDIELNHDRLLHTAVKNGWYRFAEELILHGADIEYADEAGNRMVHYLWKKNPSRSWKRLLWFQPKDAPNHAGVRYSALEAQWKRETKEEEAAEQEKLNKRLQKILGMGWDHSFQQRIFSLLKKGADPNLEVKELKRLKSDGSGDMDAALNAIKTVQGAKITPLVWAIKYHQHDALKWLIKQGVDLTYSPQYYRGLVSSPLLHAIAYGNQTALKLLQQEGVTLQQLPAGYALRVTVSQRRAEHFRANEAMLDYLLEQGEAVRWITEGERDFHEKEKFLHRLYRSNVPIELFKKVIDQLLFDYRYSQILFRIQRVSRHHRAWWGMDSANQQKQYQLLLDKGASPDTRFNKKGMTLLQFLAYPTQFPDQDKLEMLIRAGANPNHADDEGDATLHELATSLRKNRKFLLKRKQNSQGAITNRYTDDDRQNREVARALLKENYHPGMLKINELQDARNAEAVLLEMVQRLIDLGADLWQKNNRGETPCDIYLAEAGLLRCVVGELEP